MKTKNNKTIITLPCFNIMITLDDKMVGFGKITSDLNPDEPSDPMGADGSETYGAVNAIESLILAHAVAGVDVESSAYIEGIETAIDACLNNCIN